MQQSRVDYLVIVTFIYSMTLFLDKYFESPTIDTTSTIQASQQTRPRYFWIFESVSADTDSH